LTTSSFFMAAISFDTFYQKLTNITQVIQDSLYLLVFSLWQFQKLGSVRLPAWRGTQSDAETKVFVGVIASSFK